MELKTSIFFVVAIVMYFSGLPEELGMGRGLGFLGADAGPSPIWENLVKKIDADTSPDAGQKLIKLMKQPKVEARVDALKRSVPLELELL